MVTPKQIMDLSESRAELMEALEKALLSRVNSDAKVLYELIVNELISKLSVKNGKIETTAQNIRLVNTIDTLFAGFQRSNITKFVDFATKQYSEIFSSNSEYFNTLLGRKVSDADAKNVFNALLGITQDGKLVNNGYLANLATDTTIKTEIKNKVIESIATNKTVTNTTKELRVNIVGNRETKGLLNRVLAEPTIDNYTSVDGLVQATYADKIGLKDFIYQGTKRRDSRHFCIQRKGRVFSFDEANKFKDLIGKTENGKPIGPIVGTKGQSIEQKKANYNWKVKPGGWGCVDFISYISPEIAEMLREQQS